MELENFHLLAHLRGRDCYLENPKNKDLADLFKESQVDSFFIASKKEATLTALTRPGDSFTSRTVDNSSPLSPGREELPYLGSTPDGVTDHEASDDRVAELARECTDVIFWSECIYLLRQVEVDTARTWRS